MHAEITARNRFDTLRRIGDCAILPLMFICQTIIRLYSQRYVVWFITYAVLGLYSLHHLPWFFERIRKPEHLRRYVLPLFYLLIIHITTVFALQNGTITYTAPILLVGYDLLAFASACLYHRDKDAFRTGLRLTALIIWLSAVFGLIVFIATYFFQFTAWPAALSALHLNYSDIRIHSVYLNPLPASTVFLIGLWLPGFFRKKGLHLMEKATLILAIILTLSRSTWIGLMVSVFLLVYRERNTLRAFLTGGFTRHHLIILAVVVIAACLVLLRSGISSMLIGRLHFNKTDNPYLVRTTYTKIFWQESFRGPLHEVLFGHGMRASDSVIPRLGAAIAGYTTSESIYDCFVYDFGILFFVYLAVLFFRAFKQLRISKSTDTTSCCVCALLACAIPVAFYAVGYWPVPASLLIYCCAVLW